MSKILHTRSALGLGAVAWTGLAVVGCAIPSLPPPMSAARFVRLPDEGAPASAPAGGGAKAVGGSVNGSMGLLFTADQDGNSELWSVAPEASLTLGLHHRYDLAVVADTYMLAVEGNLLLLDLADVHVGFLHSIGAGVIAALQQMGGNVSDPTFMFNLSAGAFAQFDIGSRSAAFAAVRYAYSTSTDVGVVLRTHYVLGSIGFAHRIGVLRITPEFALAHGTSILEPPDSDQGFWIIVPGVTVSAPF